MYMTQQTTTRKRANQNNSKQPPDTPPDKPPDEKEEGKEARWPVESGSQLTREHIPQKLLDEIERPLRAHVRTLTRTLLDVNDRRNDLVGGADRLSKEANKDSNAVNREFQDPAVLAALKVGGVNVQAPGQPQAGGGRE